MTAVETPVTLRLTQAQARLLWAAAQAVANHDAAPDMTSAELRMLGRALGRLSAARVAAELADAGGDPR